MSLTDRPTDGRRDGLTKRGVDSRSTRLKTRQYGTLCETMSTLVACRWAGAIFEVTRPFGQDL